MRFPDVKKLMVSHLSTHLDVPVSTRVPSTRPERFVRVMLAGGEGVINPALEGVAVTIESWATVEQDAEATLQTIRQLLLFDTHVIDGHPIYAPREIGAPADLPDESGQKRLTTTIQFRLRAY